MPTHDGGSGSSNRFWCSLDVGCGLSSLSFAPGVILAITERLGSLGSLLYPHNESFPLRLSDRAILSFLPSFSHLCPSGLPSTPWKTTLASHWSLCLLPGSLWRAPVSFFPFLALHRWSFFSIDIQGHHIHLQSSHHKETQLASVWLFCQTLNFRTVGILLPPSLPLDTNTASHASK